MLQKVQRLQNSAARLLSGSRKFEHITPVLFELHWLPVKCRIKFKVLLMAFKALPGKAPQYLSRMLVYRNARPSRLSNQFFFEVRRTKCVTFGDQAFSVYAPMLWNSAVVMTSTILNLKWKRTYFANIFISVTGYLTCTVLLISILL